MASFHEFYKQMGFQKYPFRDRTAEKEDISDLFIAPPDYSVLKDTYDSGETAIISGNRGVGKTIILLKIKADSPKTIVSYIGNYESVHLTDNLLDFYSLILQNTISKTLIYLSNHKNALNKLSKDDKVFLSFLIMKYADSLTNNGLASKIENVQLSAIKKFVNKISIPLTTLLNYGTTAVANFGSELLNRHFSGYLPAVNEGKICKIIPDIHFDVDDDFKSVSISYSLLGKALLLIEKILGATPIVILDKFDEDIRLENDADSTADFIKELVCDNKLLLNKNIQLFMSVWEIPFLSLSSNFRQSKHTVFNIHWNRSELEDVLNRRLSIYSDKKICDYRSLFANDVSDELIDQMFTLSNMNPRDLWEVFDSIFKEQHKIDSECKELCATALENGLVSFVKSFSFYEYYPKKKDARKNTNDVYSYIRHLLRLNNTDEFTQDELREAASTGGSTTNYITGMVNIGLVKKTDNKRPGGSVIYKVHDPKISFAILRKIDIEH
jgi:hypothetical protein